MVESARQTRRERLEEREQAIITAAHEAFVAQGFDGARIAAIAKQAGVAEGTIYLYFKNKNALLLAVVGRFYEELTERAASGVANIVDSFDKLAFIARHHVDSCILNWPILEQMSAQYRHLADYETGAPYEYNKTYVAVFDNVITDAVNNGLVRSDVPLWIIRDQFFGGLEYSIRTHLLRGGSAEDLDTVVANAVDVLRQGIGVADSGPQRSAWMNSVVQRLEQVTERLEKTSEDRC